MADSKQSHSDTHLSPTNSGYLEHQYQMYIRDPHSVDDQWQKAFASMDSDTSVGEAPVAATLNQDLNTTVNFQWDSDSAQKQTAVLRLISVYRTRGHQIAKLDPLELNPPTEIPELDLATNGLDESDLDTVFNTGSLAAAQRMPLRDIVSLLKDVYAGPVAFEYMHIVDTPQKRWIQARLEQIPARPEYSVDQRRHILERVTAAEGIERYLHTKYVGQKRFSLEGGESLIPLLDDLIQRTGMGGAKEIVIGMAHRGRLNVLINTLGKAPADLFGEFEGTHQVSQPGLSTGDVKYHQGFSSDILTEGGPVHVALSFNPSHLEIIDPVVEGSVRARQHRRQDKNRDQVLPVLIHGDAAFAGQGVVMETFNMSQARGYGTGGTVHIIVNNQIGFTLSHPMDARSTMYCTEVAKLIQAPIFHVNGDDPEAVVFVSQLALDFRMKFNVDVVIDLICYRRHGHNEADEPRVTQPLMYRKIKSLPTTREIYAQKLIDYNVLSKQEVKSMVTNFRDELDKGHVVAGQIIDPNKSNLMVDWTPYLGTSWTDAADTTISNEKLISLSNQLQALPEGFKMHPRVAKIMEGRIKMAAGEHPLDWGFAENMAYAALIDEGYTVRLSGQDSGRGTFFHRHAVLHDQDNFDVHVPLRTIGDDPNRFVVIDSLLSEEAVLGFEYGYATTDPNVLVLWEAQFGDFANGAQVVIDQFISSGEAKWGRLCGLTLLLPHGYEGQGPEHSSARLERYLQLCADHNMQVCVPTTPAQMFHLLRRQVIRPHRRPLIVMSPKSLLRHKLSTSSVEELTQGEFQTIMDDSINIQPEKVDRIILCSGKVYFDLFEERAARNLDNIALYRIEQLQPFPEDRLKEILQRHGDTLDLLWCQEEPKNQGAWYQIRHHIVSCLRGGQSLNYVGRDASPSSAVGYYKLHMEQLTHFVDQALTVEPDTSVHEEPTRKISHVQ